MSFTLRNIKWDALGTNDKIILMDRHIAKKSELDRLKN